MASRTTYTTTITVPVYASWKCEECSEVNFSTGVIVCKREESTSSWRQSKQNEAEEMAANKAREEWTGEAYKIISDPNHNASLMFSNFYVHNTNCTKCHKKPRWNKNVRFLWTIPPIFIGGLISLFAVISDVTSLVAWLFLFGIIGITTLLIGREEKYKKMMPKFPKKYTPVIGSLNEELIEYANALGKTIPNPDECIEIVKSYDQISNASIDKSLPSFDDQDDNTSDDNAVARANFCRKCGTQLHEGSDFCHKCGTEIIAAANTSKNINSNDSDGISFDASGEYDFSFINLVQDWYNSWREETPDKKHHDFSLYLELLDSCYRSNGQSVLNFCHEIHNQGIVFNSEITHHTFNQLDDVLNCTDENDISWLKQKVVNGVDGFYIAWVLRNS